MKIRNTVALAAALLAFGASPAHAQSVSLAGQMGSKALLVIDGQPQTLAVGDSARGVKLVSMKDDQAQVERNGVVTLLRVGASPVALGGNGGRPPGAREIVMTAGPGGHFEARGSVNGQVATFLVDTGATYVAMGLADAQRFKLDLSNAKRGYSSTANGTVPVALVTLTSLRVGEIEVFNVPAVVVPAPMPHVLLGNSFLTRFQMRRENDVMRLEYR